MDPIQSEAIVLFERGVTLDAAFEQMRQTHPEVKAEHTLGVLVGIYEPQARSTERFAPVLRELVRQRKLDPVAVLTHTRHLHATQALAPHFGLDPEAFVAEIDTVPIRITYAAK